MVLRGESDHSPILLEIQGQGNKLDGPFKLNSEWMKDDSFCELIYNTWNGLERESHIRAVVKFAENIKKVKKKVHEWRKKKIESSRKSRASKVSI